jgi:hypothetical protein
MEHINDNLELIQSSYPAQQGQEPDNPTVLCQQIDPGQNDNNGKASYFIYDIKKRITESSTILLFIGSKS